MEFMIPIVLFLTTGAVLILRPLTKRAGLLLEAMAKERMRPPAADPASDPRTHALLEHMVRRLDLIEERLDFTERLLDKRRATRSLPELDLQPWTPTTRDEV